MSKFGGFLSPSSLRALWYLLVSVGIHCVMKVVSKKRRYTSPRITEASAMLLELLCNSVRFNVQVKELQNMNADEDCDEVFYFES